MSFKKLTLCALLLLVCWRAGAAQQPNTPAAQPPPDKPFLVQDEQARKLEEAIKPSIEEARKTYPDAKKRFLAGLPPKEQLYLTTRLKDDTGRYEQSFIFVKEIKDGTVKGIIANDINFITKYKRGEAYTFPESEMIDWTIIKADGTEEGNFVGKFLDTYQP